MRDEVEFYMSGYHEGRRSMLRTLYYAMKMKGTDSITKDFIEKAFTEDVNSERPGEVGQATPQVLAGQIN